MKALRNTALLAWPIIFLWGSLQAKELPTAKPEEVGMSSDKLAKVDAVMLDFVARKKLAGAIVAVARHGKVVHFGTYGKMDLERDKEMTQDAIFRIYSMSKSITTAAALMLLEEGKFSLNDPVSKYIPEFKQLTVCKDGKASPAKKTMTVKHLMLHTSGLSYGFVGNGPVEKEYKKRKPLDHRSTLQGMTKTLSEIPLAFEPGSKWQYSVSIDVLGRLIEIWSGKSFDSFLTERMFQPLEMKDTGFFVPKNKTDRFTANYGPAGPGKLRAIDDPSKSRYLNNPSLASGGGGLVSTTRDYLRFLQMILNGGELQGKRLLKKKTVREEGNRFEGLFS